MIPLAEPTFGDAERSRVLDALERGWISPKGEYVTEFEDVFGAWIGTEHAFATSTGTAALHLSLLSAGIGEGDEVIVPDLTWIACANVVSYVGATPVFADVDPDTYTLDPASVRERLTEDTKAVMPVHLYGQPCEMTPIQRLADEHDLLVLEDAAEAHGATYRGRRVGSLGDVGCFSFYGNKILTTGQGGMITTDDDELAERIRLLRRDGMSRDRKYYHSVIGYNYRLTNIQAAIGIGQVERADAILENKRRVAATYRRELTTQDVRFQATPGWGESAHWMVAPVFRTTGQFERVRNALADADVETRPFFYPLHEQPPYAGSGSDCPVTERLHERGMNLPSAPNLNDQIIIEICDVIRDAL
ncbi:DegT/DnrJ/EryC1/StrS family aminotransferase [Haloarcula sp. KBTZ06]|uniref:DegT/DnrJ/EryC1/StrS family aminotransferase n=1 Tax=unclassified Haloarcula TaxID=2624677 RepID=UPI001246EAC9|nr:DegT/DnrJ/EryC1/StrS family aminotransferase [Haloarcula sp. CBA1131]KAA9406608.1 DegT/DnrJ/EryC1/StrS family aminotransferase [Haloarcula sp. CBA1131]